MDNISRADRIINMGADLRELDKGGKISFPVGPGQSAQAVTAFSRAIVAAGQAGQTQGLLLDPSLTKKELQDLKNIFNYVAVKYFGRDDELFTNASALGLAAHTELKNKF